MRKKPKNWWNTFIAPAVNELESSLYVVSTNAPINEKEGDKDQANLERANAESFKAAIDILKTYERDTKDTAAAAHSIG